MGKQKTSNSSGPNRVVFGMWLALGFVLLIIGTLVALWTFPLILTYHPQPSDVPLYITMLHLGCPLGIIMAVLGVFLVILMSAELVRMRN